MSICSQWRSARFALVLTACFCGLLATAHHAVGVQIPGTEIIVGKSVIIDPTWGGVLGSYTYDEANNEYYVCVYGSSQGLRKIYQPTPGDPWTSDTYVGESFASYPSDMMRFARATDVPGGDTNADDYAFSMMAGILLNPASVDRTLPAPANYPATGGAYGPVDGDGNITITYAPGTLAYIVDGGRHEPASDPEGLQSKKIFTWDLREIGMPTTEQLDYDTGKSGETDAFGNLVPDQNPLGLFGAYGQTDWNDTLAVVMDESQMRAAYTAYRAANPSIGMPELPNESVDNFGRQFTWSSDGAHIYAVDKGYDIGGIYKLDASTGDTEMLHVEMSNDMYSEPTVVATSDFDFGSGAAGDQIIVNGTAYTGNPGGLTYVVDSGTSVASARPLVYGDRLQTQLGDTGVGNLNYTTSDSEGNVYFWASSTAALFQRDTAGRISKLASKAEAYEIAYEHDGKRSNGGGFNRLQVREDGAGTHVTFRADNSFIGAIHISDPADLDKDGTVDQDDRDLFIAQRRGTMLGAIPSAVDGADYVNYLAADISGDIAVDGGGVINRGSVDQMDTLLYFQHINEMPGDLDLDGTVSATEHAIVQANLGVSASWFQGDFNRDGVVTQADVDMMPAAGTTYDITNVEPTASYTGGVSGSWANVQKPSGAAADADSLITLARNGGATINGPAGDTVAGHLIVGSASDTDTGTTTLSLAADSQLDVALGLVVTGKGELDASAAGAGVKLGIPGYGATMVVEDGGTLTGAFTLEGSLRMNTSTGKALDVTIEDTDVPSLLAKGGPGALTVNSANTYTGETRIEGGSLIVGNAGAIPAASALYIGPDSTLDLGGHDVTIGGLDSDDSDFSVPLILLGANTLTYDSDDDGTFDGDISGTGGLTKSGAGQLTLYAQSSFTGGALVEEGTLRIYEDDALVPTSEATVEDGGILGLYRSDQELAAVHGDGVIANTYSGSSTSTTSYSTTLTLNTADTTGDDAVDNTFAGRITDDSGSNDIPRMAVVKTGPGTLELTGINTFENGLSIEQGALQVSGNESLGAIGGEVTVAAGAELRASGDILNRHIGGVAGSMLTATGPLLVGDASSTDGYDFAGTLDVGSHSVGLIDADAAVLNGTTTLAGGTLSSLNSINVAPGQYVVGQGTVQGAVTAGTDGVGTKATVWGDSPTEPIVMSGVVGGNGEWINVQFDGLFQPGFSPEYTLVGGATTFNALDIEIEGLAPGHYDGGDGVTGLFDQFYVYGAEEGQAGYTGLMLDGVLSVILTGYEPQAGDEFLLFETGTHSKDHPVNGTTNFGQGLLDYGTGFEIDFAAAPLGAGLQWQTTATDSQLTVRVVPEPGTLAMLAAGLFGLGLLCRRRRRHEAA